MIVKRPGEAYEAVYDSGTSGLVGTIAVRVEDNQGNIVVPASVVGIIEFGVTGVYRSNQVAPLPEGQYSLLWSDDGTFAAGTGGVEDLVVTTASPEYGPLPPLSDDGAGRVGPCSAWTTADDAALCCGDVGSDASVLEPSVIAASELLWAFSGRKYTGTCQQLVRPCADRALCDGPWERWQNQVRKGCGCTPLDRVPLAGHPREVLEVTIDGDVVDPDTYRLDEHLWLTRVRAPGDLDTPLYWPRCQDMTKPLDAEGTFGVTYTFGMDPPTAGIMAANELACAIWRTCESSDPESCPLPNGVTRVDRQGITIELAGFAAWGLTDGKWRTGMPLVDAFLNGANPKGSRAGKAQVWSPDLWRYPRPTTATGS